MSDLIAWRRHQTPSMTVNIATLQRGGVFINRPRPYELAGAKPVAGTGGLWVRAPICWIVLQGEIQMERTTPDRTRTHWPAGSGPFLRHRPGGLLLTPVEDNTVWACFNPTDARLWWDRAKYVIEPGAVLELPVSAGQQVLFVVSGSGALNGAAYGPETVREFAPNEVASLEAATNTIVVRLWEDGLYDPAPPETFEAPVIHLTADTA